MTDKASDYKTGSAEKAAREIAEAKKKKAARLKEIMGSMGHNKSGKYE